MNFTALATIFSPELATVIIAMLPVAELRAAIPIGVGVYHLDPLKVYVLSVLGSFIPAFFILALLGPLSGYLIERFTIAKNFFSWLFDHTKNKFSGKYADWGYLVILLLAALPLPGAGTWTGAVAAFIFGVPKKVALLLLLGGTAIAGLIVMLATLGLTKIF